MKKFRIAIVGLGNITHSYDDAVKSIHYFVKKKLTYATHLSAIKKDKHFILAGASDPSEQARLSFQKKIDTSVKTYADHKEMIQEIKPDVLVVASPTGTHVEICKDAIGLGVENIFCEKPIDYDLASAKELVSIVQEKNIKFSVNYFRRFDQHYKKLFKDIQSGKFGEIESVEVRYSRGVYNFASHFVNLLEKMFGKVEKVEAVKKIEKGWSRSDQDPLIDFVAYFENTKATFTAIAGEEAVVEVNLNFSKENININKDKSDQVKLDIKKSFLDVYENLYQYFSDKKESDCNAQDALQTLKVIDAVVRSAESKEAISI